MKIKVFDTVLDIKNNSIIFFDDIPSVESDYLHKIHLNNIANAMIDIGKNPIWCNNGDALIIKDLNSSTLQCSEKNMKFAIGSKGRNISDIIDRINFSMNTRLAKLNIKKATQLLIRTVEKL